MKMRLLALSFVTFVVGGACGATAAPATTNTPAATGQAAPPEAASRRPDVIYVPTPEPAAAPPKPEPGETPVESLRRIDKLWMRVEKVLWQALEPFEAAWEAVAQALAGMEPVNST